MIRAWPGEFGLKVRFHVPQVHALLGERPQPVEIEEGEEALYPRATEHIVVRRLREDAYPGASFDRGRAGRPPRLFPREERFVPEPHVRHGIRCDVVICPRRREYGASKNWPHWFALSALPGVFAAGAPDSSYAVDCPRAWDFDRFLDASIEALRAAKLCVATDAGLAHLAVLCGTPLLLITFRGRVAPGPVVDSRGRRVRNDYWPVKLDEYYRAANHTGAPILTLDAWDRPDDVVNAVLSITEAK